MNGPTAVLLLWAGEAGDIDGRELIGVFASVAAAEAELARLAFAGNGVRVAEIERHEVQS